MSRRLFQRLYNEQYERSAVADLAVHQQLVQLEVVSDDIVGSTATSGSSRRKSRQSRTAIDPQLAGSGIYESEEEETLLSSIPYLQQLKQESEVLQRLLSTIHESGPEELQKPREEPGEDEDKDPKQQKIIRALGQLECLSKVMAKVSLESNQSSFASQLQLVMSQNKTLDRMIAQEDMRSREQEDLLRMLRARVNRLQSQLNRSKYLGENKDAQQCLQDLKTRAQSYDEKIDNYLKYFREALDDYVSPYARGLTVLTGQRKIRLSILQQQFRSMVYQLIRGRVAALPTTITSENDPLVAVPLNNSLFTDSYLEFDSGIPDIIPYMLTWLNLASYGASKRELQLYAFGNGVVDAKFLDKLKHCLKRRTKEELRRAASNDKDSDNDSDDGLSPVQSIVVRAEDDHDDDTSSAPHKKTSTRGRKKAVAKQNKTEVEEKATQPKKRGRKPKVVTEEIQAEKVKKPRARKQASQKEVQPQENPAKDEDQVDKPRTEEDELAESQLRRLQAQQARSSEGSGRPSSKGRIFEQLRKSSSRTPSHGDTIASKGSTVSRTRSTGSQKRKEPDADVDVPTTNSTGPTHPPATLVAIDKQEPPETKARRTQLEAPEPKTPVKRQRKEMSEQTNVKTPSGRGRKPQATQVTAQTETKKPRGRPPKAQAAEKPDKATTKTQDKPLQSAKMAPTGDIPTETPVAAKTTTKDKLQDSPKDSGAPTESVKARRGRTRKSEPAEAKEKLTKATPKKRVREPVTGDDTPAKRTRKRVQSENVRSTKGKDCSQRTSIC